MVAAIVLGVLGLTALAVACAWLLGWEPVGAGSPLRASFAEAGQRTADAAAELWEWIRIGR